MHIGVVGCGYSGGACALFLKRSGHDVELFEAVPSPAPVGAGILIQPTGLAVLNRLGLVEQTLARAAHVGQLRMRTVAGAELMRLRYDRVAPNWFGAGLHRGALFEALFEAVKLEVPGLHLGTPIADMEAKGAQHVLIDEGGQRHGPFDLVVVADGSRSSLRTKLGVGRTTTYPFGTAWYVGPSARFGESGELYQVVDGTRKLAGFLPTGLGPTSSSNQPLVSLYYGLHADHEDDWRRAGLASFRADVRRLEPEAEAMVDQIDDLDEVLFARYHRVIMRPWHRPGLVFIGDAAHAMSPQLGQGTNLALLDAMVLSECLEEQTLERALDEYDRRRRHHLRYYEWAAHFLMPMFQSNVWGMGGLRNVMFWLMSHVPIAGGQMIRTMAGIKRGLVRPSLQLPLDALPAAGVPAQRALQAS